MLHCGRNALVCGLALALALGGCRQKPPAGIASPEAAAAPTVPVAPAAARAPAAFGRIAGTVVFLGAVPPQTMYVAEAGDLEAHAPIVDLATRGLKDAVVWLETVSGIAPPPASPRAAPHAMDQSSFNFVPHVLAVRAGAEVRFTNSDNANHNIHCLDSRQAFNAASTPGVDIVRRFVAPSDVRPLELRCDVHAWMKAWLYVFDHPWFAVTDARGAFSLEAVPAGDHTLRVAHADSGLTRSVPVHVEAGRPAAVTIELGAHARIPR